MFRNVTLSPNAAAANYLNPYSRSAVVSHSSVLACVQLTVGARANSKNCTLSLRRVARRRIRLSALVNHSLLSGDLDKLRVSSESEGLLRRRRGGLVLFLHALELADRQDKMTSLAHLQRKRSRPRRQR